MQNDTDPTATLVITEALSSLTECFWTDMFPQLYINMWTSYEKIYINWRANNKKLSLVENSDTDNFMMFLFIETTAFPSYFYFYTINQDDLCFHIIRGGQEAS